VATIERAASASAVRAASTREDPVAIAVDDQALAGTFVSPGTLLPGVLFVHGWGGSQQQYLARAREIAALGCICLTFNLRGHVETRPLYETVSRELNLRDVVAAYDALTARRHVDPGAIAVVGSSYGGYLAAILTSLRPVKWLALRAPALYYDTDWSLPKLKLHQSQDLKSYRRSPVAPAENRALVACQAFLGDVLLVESENDDVIPQPVLSSYREACTHAHSLTYRMIRGADHGLTTETDQRAYTSLLVNWFSEMVVGARAVAAEKRVQVAEPASMPESPPLSVTAHAGSGG
jgi:dienelactone hydrolase